MPKPIQAALPVMLKGSDCLPNMACLKCATNGVMFVR